MGGSLTSGFSWNVAKQTSTAIATLLVIPIAVHRMGLGEYGTYTLATAAVALLQQLDGGMVNAAARYLGISAGASDRERLSQQFATIAALICLIAGCLGAAVYLCASLLVEGLNLGPELQSSGLYAARIVGLLIPLGMMQGLLTALLQVHGRFRLTAVVGGLCQVCYVPAVIILVHHVHGVQEIMRLTLLQQLLLIALLLPTAGRLVAVRSLRLLPASQIREIFIYSTQVQLFTLFGLVNMQADALIIGALLPVRYVGIYGIGAGVATQLRSIPLNLGTPVAARLARTQGRSGPAAAFSEYKRLQKPWVTLSTGFSAVAMGAAAFQIEAWLGHRFLEAGIVCVILVASNLVNLLTMTLTLYLQVIGKPQAEVRYGLIAASLNVGLTVATAWLGLYAIVAATAVGQVVGSLALMSLARSAVSRELPSFLTPTPWACGALTAIVTGVIALGLLAVSPWHGPAGLLFVSMSWMVGACVFFILVVGQREARSTLAITIKLRSLKPLVEAVQ